MALPFRPRVLLLLLLLLAGSGWAQTSLEIRGQLRAAANRLEQGEPREALEIVSRALDLSNAAKLEASALAADLYVVQARALAMLDSDAEAVAAFDKARAILKALGGQEWFRQQQLLSVYGDYQKSKQRYELSIALYHEALALEPETSEPATSEKARLLHRLAGAYRDQGRLEQALETFRQALELKEGWLAQDDPSLAVTLSDLGGVYRQLGRFQQAETCLRRALRIRQERKEASPDSFALALNNLGLLKDAMGERREALDLIKSSLALYESHHGALGRETMVTRMNLAALYSSLGDFEQAERLYQLSLWVACESFGGESLEAAQVRHNLGTLMLTIKDLEKAQKYLEQALATRRRLLGTTNPELAPTLINLATVHREAGRDEAAILLYKEALALGEKALGPNHPDLAYTLDLLSGVPRLAETPDQVRALILRAYEIRLKAFGPKAVQTAQSLHSLGLWSQRQGDLPSARQRFQESLAIFREQLGPLHFQTATVTRHLAEVDWEEGRPEQALKLARQEGKAVLANTEQIFSFGSERQRLAYAGQLKPYDLLASLGAADEIATAVLRYKGAVLDSMMEDLGRARASDQPEAQANLEALRQVRESLADLLGNPDEGAPVDQARLDSLRQELERLESAVARGGVPPSQELRRAFQVRPEQVTEVLPERSVLVEFVRYNKILKHGQKQDSYGAVVLARGRKPAWTDLGSALEIEALVLRYKRFVRDRVALPGRGEEILKELRSAVWDPLTPSLPMGTDTVLVSPDSELNFVSFATLADADGQLLGQVYNWLYVASGRDLLRTTASFVGREAVLLGAPVYTDNSLEPLPSTRLECQELARLLGSWPGWKVRELLGPQAGEAQVKAVHQPALLHIATHGYFGYQRDPMASSGLILSAGPGDSGQGPVEDGYLTAGEVSLLDLAGTTLVTLSACDTGQGVAQAGEGVLGLRRGFLKAGARNLVMTLWSVDDQVTAAFMQDFLSNARQAPPALAFARTQREWLSRLSAERSQVEAVRLVGPFVLNLQGRWADNQQLARSFLGPRILGGPGAVLPGGTVSLSR